MLETKILNYLNYLGDSEYMAEVVTSPGAVDTLIKLLESQDEIIVGDACLFITDFVLSCSRNDVCKLSWETNLGSAIIPELEHLVFANNHFIRKQVIYTLGKICSYNSVPVLLHAFHQFRDQDPILLPRLIGELFWLGVDNRCDVIESMIFSAQYITRWSVLETLHQFIYDSQLEDANFLIRYKFCEKLRQDSNLLVRAQAEYEFNFLDLNKRRFQENMCKSDYRKQKKILDKSQPFLCFSQIANSFTNYMHNQNLSTYIIQELENFIEEKHQNL
ncbi:HEAT repeat domain-containing protein [Nostoc sp. CENA67]|uniref:HEAT repeat domain-containing protein n=1 Tax=Amazonocrinis nigriterrae CENA67 TaxID=2794033 RepID=A0A8J7LE09_9NOST|nr:HEAT repeat domain-containing protein [Amazonocrinis nigriterrae]MBH8566241.1 HEAT repeat domain-containing protein [Amazonocrinis nigriterrae CENA67]